MLFLSLLCCSKQLFYYKMIPDFGSWMAYNLILCEIKNVFPEIKKNINVIQT